MVAMSTVSRSAPAGADSLDAERFWWPLLLMALALGCLLALTDDDWPVAIAVGVVCAAGIAALRQHRVFVVVASTAVAMFLAIAMGADLAMLPLVGYTCFYLAYREPLSTAVPVGVGIALVLAVVVPVVDRERLDPLTVVGVISVVLLPLLLGIVLEQQRQQVRSQVAAATATHTEQVRLAIARDLHDIVAHGLTAVAIQSGTAIHLFDTKPERAREALANVNEASRSALTELRVMVGELRSTEESRPTGSEDPVAAAIARISPTMAVVITGQPLPATTPNTVRIAIERVVGEALANVIAHGGSGPTTIDLQTTADRIHLTIDNDQGPSAVVAGSTGFGIVGMAERLSALGGTLDAGPRPGGFTVRASIPRGEW